MTPYADPLRWLRGDSFSAMCPAFLPDDRCAPRGFRILSGVSRDMPFLYGSHVDTVLLLAAWAPVTDPRYPVTPS